MCGIVASLGLTSKEVMISMRDTLRHRGPDAAGLAWWPEAALAHRRLAIIDIQGGKQPLSNEDGTIWVTFDGKIYNFERLRSELEDAGHRFATQSDTEVLVHLYEEEGERCVERLRGDFAFAIWDRRRKELYAARDRIGVKPLCYASRGDVFLAASEPKALLAHPAVSRDLDPLALDQYLSYLYVPPPRTIFGQIRQLPPAHWLRFGGGVLKIARYWQPPLTRDDAPTHIEDAVAEVRDALDDAVRVRLMSEVPLGAFLSGGVDSSSLVAAMAQASHQQVRTFTIRFPSENNLYDEGPAASRVAKHLGSNHIELEAKANCTDYLEDMVRGFDQPFGNPTSLLVYILSELTRQHVSVALAGDGGDELFGGYPRYKGLRWLDKYRFVPRVLRKIVGRVAGTLIRDRLDGRHGMRRIRQFLEVGGTSVWDDYLNWIGYWSGFAKAKLYSGDFKAQIKEADRGQWLAGLVERLPTADLLASASALDMMSILPENSLAYSDRMSMAHALEVRVPFTDHLLIERILPLKPFLKWPRGQLKGLLKAAAADRLPAETLRAKKVGFNPPMAAWLTGHVSSMLDEYLSAECVRRRRIFQVQQIEALKDQLRSRTRDVSLQLWALIALECWMREYLD